MYPGTGVSAAAQKQQRSCNLGMQVRRRTRGPGWQARHALNACPHPHPQGQGSFPGRDATAASNLFFRLSTSSSAVTQIKPTWADRLYPGRPVYHLAALHHPPSSALGTCTQYLPACLPACSSLSLSPSFASRALFCADTPFRTRTLHVPHPQPRPLPPPCPAIRPCRAT